jgi:L-rhamnose mutarotase
LERVCFLLRVRADRLDEYRARHREVWPDMLRALSESGWRNYSLFLRPDGLLVGYLECEDFERAQAEMDARDVNTRWQADMAPFFDPAVREGPGSARTGATSSLKRLEEVFHLA